MNQLRFLPCLDSDELAHACRRALDIRFEIAESLGRSALEAIDQGQYLAEHGIVDWSKLVESATAAKVSIPPGGSLPLVKSREHAETHVTVINQTTLGASRELVDRGQRPLALNFANGVQPGGGFLWGATAQEETLCRSSALFATLFDDPMYEFHRQHDPAASSDWAILSPDVPVFRGDEGRERKEPWLLSFLTCAAPYAPGVGHLVAEPMLRERIHRVLAIAQAYQYESLILGAWGCGAFANDPKQTAIDFRAALEGEFAGAFASVVFAIADWSENRRIFRPFCEVFSSVEDDG